MILRQVGPKIGGLRLSLMVAKYAVALAALLLSFPVLANVAPGAKALERGRPFTALRSWLPLARGGNPKAQNNVGLIYERGAGVSQNYSEAMKWYRLAVAQGLPEAHHNIGLLYYSGYGTEVNDREALRYFRFSADKQLAESQYMLGLMVYYGRGTEINAVRAKNLFEFAAIQGYPEAQYMLGFLYQSGDLGNVRPDLAYVWSKISMDQGVELAAELNYLSTLILDEEEQQQGIALADLCRNSNYTDCPK